MIVGNKPVPRPPFTGLAAVIKLLIVSVFINEPGTGDGGAALAIHFGYDPPDRHVQKCSAA